MQAELKIENLALERGVFALKVPALTVPAGKITMLSGPSGSGKSTVLQAIAGFLDPKAGKILWKDDDLLVLPPERRKVGYVFQDKALFPNMTVLENVAFSLRVRGVGQPERGQKSQEWLERVGLKDHAKKSVDQISGGQAQRVQLARALIAGFPILLLDEPFSALDTELKSDLRRLLKSLVAETGVACLLVSHDPDDKAALADRCYSIQGGTVNLLN